MITELDIIEACRQVQDPEIRIDIYTLGLIYRIEITPESDIHILMTYTTPLCPFGERMKTQLTTELEKLNSRSIDISVTFEPKWEASQELRDLLGV